MLAQQHGLALITEKLQNQRLEEPAAGSSGVVPAVTASTSICGKLPGVSQDAFLISESCTGRGHSSLGLSVKGKNLWTASQADSDRYKESTHQKCSGIIAASYPSSSPRSILPLLCHHKKQRHLCQICDIGPGTPSAPPKKKHCRSLSVPPDGPSTPTFFPSGKDSATSPGARFSIGIGGSQSHWLSNFNHHHCPPSCHSSHHHSHHHHHTSKIWRPIAVVPLRNASQSTSSFSPNTKSVYNSINSNKIKEKITSNSNQRNLTSNADNVNNDNDQFSNSSSNISCSSSNNNYLWSTSVSGFDEKNNMLDATMTSNNYNRGVCQSTSGFHYHYNKCHKLMPPSSSSSVSFDSGHFTTSDFQSPSCSPPPPPPPIPDQRPASAASDTSFSSLGWFDFSPMPSRLNILQNRSLSCEDRISACSSCCSSASSPIGATCNNTTSMPCVYNTNTTTKLGEENMDVPHGNSGGNAVCCPHAGVSSSAGIGGGDIIPRCHSQPCVLHHRRCGKKRRRDCDRPTLNFNKMTETAYSSSPGPHRKSEPWSYLPCDLQIRPWKSQGHTSFIKSNQIPNPFVLNPIASSPSDTSSEFLMSKHLPQTISHSGRNVSTELLSQRSKPIRHDVLPIGQIDSNEDGEEKEEISYDEEDDDDVEEEGNCSCHDPRRKTDNMAIFPVSDFDDLDLEQIETH